MLLKEVIEFIKSTMITLDSFSNVIIHKEIYPIERGKRNVKVWKKCILVNMKRNSSAARSAYRKNRGRIIISVYERARKFLESIFLKEL